MVCFGRDHRQKFLTTTLLQGARGITIGRKEKVKMANPATTQKGKLHVQTVTTLCRLQCGVLEVCAVLSADAALALLGHLSSYLR